MNAKFTCDEILELVRSMSTEDAFMIKRNSDGTFSMWKSNVYDANIDFGTRKITDIEFPEGE